MSEKRVLPVFPCVKCGNGEFWPMALYTAESFSKSTYAIQRYLKADVVCDI